MIISIALLILFAITKNEWFLLIVPYFLVRRMIQEYKLHKIRKLLDQQHIKYNKTYDELTNAEYWRIREVALAEDSSQSKNIITTDYVAGENENEVISYVKSILKNTPTRDLSILGIIIFMLIWVAGIAVPVLLMM